MRLSVYVVQGFDLRGKDLYTKVEFNKTVCKTLVNTKKDPRWEQRFDYLTTIDTALHSVLRISVWESNIFSPDTWLAGAQLPLSRLIESQKRQQAKQDGDSGATRHMQGRFDLFGRDGKRSYLLLELSLVSDSTPKNAELTSSSESTMSAVPVLAPPVLSNLERGGGDSADTAVDAAGLLKKLTFNTDREPKDSAARRWV
jgi:hypothetical protein